jgi:hypothetical protein
VLFIGTQFSNLYTGTTLHICLLCLFFFFWTHFGFDTLFGLFVLLFALQEAFKLQPVRREAALLVHVRPYFIFSFFAHRLLLF